MQFVDKGGTPKGGEVNVLKARLAEAEAEITSLRAQLARGNQIFNRRTLSVGSDNDSPGSVGLNMDSPRTSTDGGSPRALSLSRLD